MRLVALCQNGAFPDCFCHNDHLDCRTGRRRGLGTVMRLGTQQRPLQRPFHGGTASQRSWSARPGPQVGTTRQRADTLARTRIRARAGLPRLPRHSMRPCAANSNPPVRKCFTYRTASDLTLDAVYTHDPSLGLQTMGLIPMNPGKPNRIPGGQSSDRDFCKSLGIPAAGRDTSARKDRSRRHGLARFGARC